METKAVNCYIETEWKGILHFGIYFSYYNTDEMCLWGVGNDIRDQPF